jgi:23S rRNA pseudouridine1911/1915/1917 synthase
MRVDSYISDVLGVLTRSQLKSRVEKVLINGREVKLARRIHSGDELSLSYNDPLPSLLVPEKMELRILFENENSLALDKPQGIVVHPGSGNRTGTLLNGIVWYCREVQKSFPDDSLRPGIVHRLDKETSGVVVVAKNPEAYEFLCNQFRKRRVKKKYIAIVKGKPPAQEGRIETFIARDPRNRKRFTCSNTKGKKAITTYELVRTYDGYSLLRLFPLTGRTHQLRVHMKRAGCPILGDDVYGRKDRRFPEVRLLLHAITITLTMPFEKTERSFRAPLPERFREVIREIRTSSSG